MGSGLAEMNLQAILTFRLRREPGFYQQENWLAALARADAPD